MAADSMRKKLSKAVEARMVEEKRNATKVIKAVLRKIKPQFSTTDSGKLMMAVWERAVVDSLSTDGKADRHTARLYLTGDMPHLQFAGVDYQWATEVMTRYGLYEMWKLPSERGEVKWLQK